MCDEQNPYKTPVASIENSPEGSFSLVAVLIGAAVGNGILYAVSSTTALIFLWCLAFHGVSPESLYLKLCESTGYLVLEYVLSLLCLISGGYWSAKLGPQSPYRHALASGTVFTLLTVIHFFYPFEIPHPIWSRPLLLVTTIPAFLLGARWWRNANPVSRQAEG